MIAEIRSGGQTGVDRAALDVAIAHGIPHAGWVPRRRRAEDGPIPARYTGLRETGDDAYATRTEWNVRDADATLVVTVGRLAGGSLFTVETAARLNKPHLVVDLEREDVDHAARTVWKWLATLPHPVRLNVAGPRASDAPDVYGRARALLDRVLGPPDGRYLKSDAGDPRGRPSRGRPRRHSDAGDRPGRPFPLDQGGRSMRPAVMFSCLFLALVAAGHVLRLAFQVPVVVGTIDVPMWPSVLAVLVPGGLSVWLWREGRPRAS